MKKLIGLASIVTITCTLVGCGTDPAPKEARIQIPSAPFSFDYRSSTDSYDYFSNNDSIATLMAASPYYLGAKPLALPAFQQFDELKKAKVSEAESQTKVLLEKTKALHSSVDEFKQALIELITVAVAKEPKIKPFAKAVAGDFATYYIDEQALIAQYDGLSKQTVTDPFASSFIEYQKTAVAFDLAEKVTNDLAAFLTNSASISLALESTTNSDIKHALGLFDTNMEGISSLNPQIDAMNAGMENLQNSLQQLATADHYFGLAGIEFLQNSLPDLQKKVASLKPSESLTSEDITTIKQYTDLFDSFSKALKQNLDAVPADELIQVSMASNQTVAIAYADDTSYLERSYNALKTGGQIAAKGASLAWQGAKQTFKGAQIVAGITLDTLGAAEQSALDIGYNTFGNGGKLRNIPKDIRNNFHKIQENYNKGVSGASTFKTSEDYLNNVETTAQDLFETGTTQYIGSSKPASKISWLSGQIAKLTVGLFTGFGKGIFKVANPESTPGEYVDGVMDIGFSFIGGSKVVIKGSQAGVGLKEGATIAGKGALNSLQRLANNLKNGVLNRDLTLFLQETGQTLEQALKGFPKKGELEQTQILAKTLKQAAEDIQKSLLQALEDGGKTIWGNVTPGIGNSYHEFIKETFEKTTDGIKKSLSTILGKSYTDYFDNIVGAALDDSVKGLVKSAVDSSLGLVNYDGTFSGAIVLEDLPFPVTLVIVDNTITGSISTSFDLGGLFGGEPDPITFNGIINGSVTNSGQILGTFQGPVIGVDKPTTVTGSFGGDIGEGSVTLNQIMAKVTGGKQPFGPYSGTLSKQ